MLGRLACDEMAKAALINRYAQFSGDVFMAVLFDLAFNLFTMIKVVTEGIMDFGRREMRVTCQIALDRFAQMNDRLPNLPHRNARAANDRPTAQDSRHAGDVWVFGCLPAISGTTQCPSLFQSL